MRSLIKAAYNKIFRALPLQPALQMDFLCHHGRLPRLDPPRTFCEKILHRRLVERDPRMTLLADKVQAKLYVAAQLGEQWVIPTLWSGQKLPPRSHRQWPIPYVLKANHGSGWAFFVRSQQEQDWDRIEQAAGRWLQRNYGREHKEWLYEGIRPTLLVEPYLGEGEVTPPDYKFHVFAGKTAFVQIDTGRYQAHRQFFYDPAWKRLPYSYVCPFEPGEVEQPPCLEAMLLAADRLGSPFPYVRVDLYQCGGKPYFGEFTFYPNSGRVPFQPRGVEQELGRLWPG